MNEQSVEVLSAVFKAAWARADAAGMEGCRTHAGIRAVLKELGPNDTRHMPPGVYLKCSGCGGWQSGGTMHFRGTDSVLCERCG